MDKKILLLIAMMPLLNFLHESGHWVGGKLVGADPEMHLQRVEAKDESRLTSTQVSIYNWGGPAVNHTIISLALVSPALVPVAFMMTCHRLGPNIFASYLYLSGNRNFTTDETKQFSKEARPWAALLFSTIYLGVAILLVRKWVLVSKRLRIWTAIPAFSVLWLGYLILLDQLDKRS